MTNSISASPRLFKRSFTDAQLLKNAESYYDRAIKADSLKEEMRSCQDALWILQNIEKETEETKALSQKITSLLETLKQQQKQASTTEYHSRPAERERSSTYNFAP